LGKYLKYGEKKVKVYFVINMLNVCHKNEPSPKYGGKYDIMLNHEVVQHDYEVTTH
jgi:hypothetical protein